MYLSAFHSFFLSYGPQFLPITPYLLSLPTPQLIFSSLHTFISKFFKLSFPLHATFPFGILRLLPLNVSNYVVLVLTVSFATEFVGSRRIRIVICIVTQITLPSRSAPLLKTRVDRALRISETRYLGDSSNTLMSLCRRTFSLL